MLPPWMTKSDSIFAMVLWVTSPIWFFVVERIWKQIRPWYASITESSAAENLVYLDGLRRYPPSLLQELAIIICFLPLPFALGFCVLFIHFIPLSLPEPQIDPILAHRIVLGRIDVILGFFYVLYAGLTLHGFRVAWRLRHGVRWYDQVYKANIEDQMEKIRKKYPNLRTTHQTAQD